MAGGDFDFGGFVTRRLDGVYGGGRPEARYAYAADVAMLKTFRRIRPVELAAAATVRMYKAVLKNQFMGTMVRVSERQFPDIHRLVVECAETLGVQPPTVYVANSPVINAYTFGTDEDSFIVIHSALIDHFDEQELKFVIGHETGHVQNKHVIYGTVLHLMRTTAAVFLSWIVPPAEMALKAWYRRAEITCDRAGLLCVGDIDPACRAFLKMASGSQKLYEQLDLEEYLEQLTEVQTGVGRYSEAFATHPYLPKRIGALRVFAKSALYRAAIGEGDGTTGLTMEEVDEQTSKLVRIIDHDEHVLEKKTRRDPASDDEAGGATDEHSQQEGDSSD